MDQRYGPSAADQEDDGGLAAARLHVQALTENGLSPEALLRALLEKCEGQSPTTSVGTPRSQNPTANTPAPEQMVTLGFKAGHNARLSISTTNSGSTDRTNRSSVLSMATSISSVSSHGSMSRFSQVPGTQQFHSRPSTRAYWCTSCPQKLQRKFDWKRHEDEFHERYKKYPCPDCNRVFWGANTFNQHHKSRHSCTTCPHAEKVVRYSKRKRAWGCGFCAAFLPSLERYFDHVAVHYESGKTKAHWDHALVIYGLLHQPIVYDAWKALKTAKYGHLPREQQPKISWDPRNTSRAHGFLENENPGQLQDLLEFFDPSRDNAHTIVELAWEQAIHVTQASYDVRHPIDVANVRRPAEPPAPLQIPRQQQPLPKSKWSPVTASAPISSPGVPADATNTSTFHSNGAISGINGDVTGIPDVGTPASPQHQPQSQPLDSRPLPEPMALDRPLPPTTFEPTFYPNPIAYSPASLSPPPALDFAPFDPTLNFNDSMLFDDWNSLASTMVEDALAPPPGSHQQLQQIQLQQQQQQQQHQHQPIPRQEQQQQHPHQMQPSQNFWQPDLFASHP